MTTTEIQFKNGKIEAEVADNIISRSIGLSFRKGLRGDRGMVFRFYSPIRPLFWNFGMLFPIDVLWIRNGEIIEVRENIPEMKKGIRFFTSNKHVQMIVELPAGSVKRLDINVCDKITIVA